MSSFEQFKPYLQPGYPKYTDTESQIGNEYFYKYPDAELSVPVTGQLWEDGRLISSVNKTPKVDGSTHSELTVSTLFSRTSGPAISDLEDVRTATRAQVVAVELLRHSAFQVGGEHDLWSANVTSGSLTGKPIEFIAQWENEQDPRLKAKRQFLQRDINGLVVSPTPISLPTECLAFVKLRQLGYQTKNERYYVHSKISVYRGINPPADYVQQIGQYVATSTIYGIPPAVALSHPQAIKEDDNYERVGDVARYQRSEVWHCFKKVYFDDDEINPAGNTLP